MPSAFKVYRKPLRAWLWGMGAALLGLMGIMVLAVLPAKTAKAQATTVAVEKHDRVPPRCFNIRSVHDYQAVGDDKIMIKDQSGGNYLLSLSGTCQPLNSNIGLALMPRSGGGSWICHAYDAEVVFSGMDQARCSILDVTPMSENQSKAYLRNNGSDKSASAPVSRHH